MNIDSVKEAYMHEAEELYSRMKGIIVKTIKNVLWRSRAYEENDYRQQAFIACYDTILKYSPQRNAELTDNFSSLEEELTNFMRLSISEVGPKADIGILKKEHYAFWLIKKSIYALACPGEVLWDVFDSAGEYVETLIDSDFRKQRKTLMESGHTFNAHSRYVELKDKDGKPIDPAERFITKPLWEQNDEGPCDSKSEEYKNAA